MRGVGAGPSGRPGIADGSGTRARTARRRTPAGLLGVLVVAGALAGCGGGGDDPRKAVAEAVTAMQAAVGDDPARVDGGVLCDALDPGSRTAVERLGGEITGVRSVRDCPGVLQAARWRVRPFAGVAPGGSVDLERVTVDGDEATVRPAGSGAPLRLQRIDDEWRADLMAEPRWRYRLERSRACTAAGRRFARLRLPTAGASSVGPYLRAHVAILRRFERDLGELRAPVELRARDARLQSSVRSSRRRTQAAARRLRAGDIVPGAAVEVLLRSGWDPAAQLPGAISRRVYPITEGCLNASTRAVDRVATKRVQRRCTVAGRRVLELENVTSPAGYERTVDRVADAFEALGRAVGRTTPPPPVTAIHDQTVAGIRRIGRDMRGLAVPARAGDLDGLLVLSERLSTKGAALDHGLAQLGFGCGLPVALPTAPTTKA